MLSTHEFKEAGRLTQFVSIDLIVEWTENNQTRYLVGERKNNPAKGTLFVPGAKTFKGNTLASELTRVSLVELGVPLALNEVEFLGVFDHIYDHNFQDSSYGTHYVVMAVKFVCQTPEQVKLISEHLLTDQHTGYQWLTASEILANSQVHQFTKNYFLAQANNVFWRHTHLST